MGKLSELSTSFGIEIIEFCGRLKNSNFFYPNISQLVRSGTSVGANISEANYAVSRADFINKLQLALKECNESYYWLSIFSKSKIIKENEYQSIISKCNKIRFLLITSLKTAKTNDNCANKRDVRSKTKQRQFAKQV